jgi:RimJ/RimL family protein N-acetyltransferase
MKTSQLLSDRLRLSPLREADADSMLGVLSDPLLYVYTGEEPPTIDALRERYRQQARGAPAPSSEEWLNWIMWSRHDESPVGFVQATVTDREADLAWLVGMPWQGQGLATEAVGTMRDWLVTEGIEVFRAHIHPDHEASQRVARKLGLQVTGSMDSDGEMIWELVAASNPGVRRDIR